MTAIPGPLPPPESMRPTLVGDCWSIVGGHPLVSQVGAEVLSRGGNAIDAGVAAGLAANVVQLDMCNFGGIAPILVRPAGESAAYAVGGVGRWGAAADRAEIQSRYGGDLPLGGVPSIVPGAPSGWITALERFGTWSFAEVAAPAIELALRGFPLDQRTAKSLEVAGAEVPQWPSSLEVLWPDGRAPRTGDRLRQPRLGTLLQDLAAAESNGSRVEGLQAVHDRFYRGPAARVIADFVTARGGYLTAADLADFRAEVAPGPSYEYAGWRLHATPTWTQGLIVAQTLAILQPFDLAGLGHNSADHLHLVIEALKLAFSDREEFYGDPRFTGLDPSTLLTEEHVGRLRSLIGERALPSLPAHGRAGPALRSTTSLTVVDAASNAFSVSPSDTIEGAPLIPELGIMCSPRGHQSRLAAGHPNELVAGKRPCVTPSPLIALRRNDSGDDDVWALACPGGDVIVQALLQAFLNVTAFGMTPQQAVEAPRVAGHSFPNAFHPHGTYERGVRIEERIPEPVRADLTARGHELHLWPGFEVDAGSVQMSLSTRGADDEQPVLSAAADPRRTAYALVR